jgi:peptide/nickel transport system substrate-binding protein
VALARVGVAVVATLALILGAAACGDDDAPAGSTTEQPSQVLAYAVSSASASTDPLKAGSRAAQLVTAQVHEPLVERLIGPYGDTRPRRGLATSWSHSADNQVWRFRLRRGISFQDGTPFNASAAVANARRWRLSAVGQRLIPGLSGADAPTPSLVRFVLSRSDPRLPQRLADVRLGIVSPAALEGTTRLGRHTRTGTGPFHVRQRDGGVLLTRYADWWGTPVGLGPALERVEFRFVPRQAERLTLLRRGEVQVADEFDSEALRLVESDPVLTTLNAGPGQGIGFERSVRELPAAPHGFGGVWLTRVGQQ